MISITELSIMFGVTVRTIRYYEELGLIEESTRINNKRYFSRKSTIDKMKEIFF
ncbi:MerR family DNA-binding transcriptional regulator [Enterococcus faecalis]